MEEKKKYDKKVKRKSIASNVLLSMSVIFGIMPVITTVYMVSLLMKKQMSPDILLLCGSAITLSLMLKSLFYGLSVWQAHKSAYEVLTDIRIDMIEHLKKLPLGFFQKRKTGDLTNIINHDVEEVETYLAHGLPEIMSATVIPAVIFIVVTIIDWRMGLSLICSIPFILLLNKVLTVLWKGVFEKFSESTKKMSEDLLEYISTISVVKAFSHEENKTQNVIDAIHNYNSWVKKALLAIAIPMSFMSVLLEGGLLAMIIAGSILLTNGQIETQSFILAIILGGIFTDSFARMESLQHYQIIFNQSMERINSVMGETPFSSQDSQNTVPVAGNIVFDDVSFSYTGKDEVLSHINLCFKENSVNAIVGHSGSGKSTLASLIMRFWEPDSGIISIGGQKISEMSGESLSSLVSIVQQDVFLFNISIRDNIRIGNPDATNEEIIEAAKKAQIHDMIENLPQGYDTRTGEAGAKLSGGEKQRISIARMILKDTPVIIMDEATAAIDPNNEHLIQKAISNLGENKTVITIAHHLNSITGADQIVVMNKGEITATGKNEELLSTCEQYAEMIEYQNRVDNWQIKEAIA